MENFDDFKWLNNYTPCFTVDPSDIEILHSPQQFYTHLKVRDPLFIIESI